MILDKIAEHKRREVAQAKERRPIDSLRRGVGELEDLPRGFLRALRAYQKRDRRIGR